VSIPMTASRLFGRVHSLVEGAGGVCHWCGGECGRKREHNEPPRRPFVPYRNIALRPNSPYVCEACHVYPRPRVTARFLSGGFKDGQCLKSHSWFMDAGGIWVIGEGCGSAVIDRLMRPPEVFALALTTTGETLLQYAVVNYCRDAVAEALLTFTLDGKVMTYSVYELEQVAETGELSGKMPGVRYLCEKFGLKREKKGDEVKRGRGRPPSQNTSTPYRRIVPSE
jgi:hypothetical protein